MTLMTHGFTYHKSPHCPPKQAYVAVYMETGFHISPARARTAPLEDFLSSPRHRNKVESKKKSKNRDGNGKDQMAVFLSCS